VKVLLDTCVWGKAREEVATGALVTADQSRVRVRSAEEKR